jgi:adenine phosphoribosyltransferase
MDLKKFITNVPDFPKQGVMFRDIQPLLADPEVFEHAIVELGHLLPTFDFDYVVGIESRGFIIGQALAWSINKGFKMIRKEGKLPPYGLSTVSYKLEYGESVMQMQKGKGRVIIVDDVLATGGTFKASELLCRVSGYEIVDRVALIDIGLIKNHDVKCLISY